MRAAYVLQAAGLAAVSVSAFVLAGVGVGLGVSGLLLALVGALLEREGG